MKAFHRKRNTLLLLTSLICWQTEMTHARAQDVRDPVQVQLSLADGKSVFRTGDPIRLILTFTANSTGYQLNNTTTKPAHPIDQIMISPDSGVFHWLDEYSGKNRYYPDYSAVSELTQSPTRVELPLNDWFRFDRPGKYTVKIKTGRVSHPPRPLEMSSAIPLVTNEVSFEIVPMSDEEEAREILRLSSLLSASHTWQKQAEVAEELSYLSGDASTREKVRWFLDPPEGPGNFSQNIYFGLFIARNRALAVRLLEAALRDPSRGVTSWLLGTTSSLRLLLERKTSPAPGGVAMIVREQMKDQSYEKIQRGYLTELFASLPKRSGKSKTTTAMAILFSLAQDKTKASNETLAKVREILIQEFDSLHPFDQDILLNGYWEQMKDRALLPAIERMLTQNRTPEGQMVRTAALKRLIELAPERAQPHVIAEISNPNSDANSDVLKTLGDAVLPEVDGALLKQIGDLAAQKSNVDIVRLKNRTELAARFSTAANYNALMEIYRKYGGKWQPDTRANLLAYFARHNETEALPLIEKAMEEIGIEQYFNFLPDLTRLYYSDGIDAMLRRILERDETEAVNTASYVMSQYGTSADEKPIEARYERWMKEWGERVVELDGADSAGANVRQAMVQVNLIIALTRSERWKLPAERVKELEQSCQTKICQSHFANR